MLLPDIPEQNRVGKLMPSCPYTDLHESSVRKSATVRDWGRCKWSVFQNSSSEQLTSALQRTVLPQLLEELEDKMTFLLHLTGVFLLMKLSQGATSSGSWSISEVLESNLIKPGKSKQEKQCTAHLFLWNSCSDWKRAGGNPSSVQKC